MDQIALPEGTIYPRSIVEHDGATYFLCKLEADGTRRLGVIGSTDGFAGTKTARGALLCTLTAQNAATLRKRLPWLVPAPLGLQTSFGFGDRMGSATPGHIQALRAMPSDNPIAPIFAQQSVRENARTGRTPQQVLDDVMWGVFQEGWRKPWGADADHVKEIAYIGDVATFEAELARHVAIMDHFESYKLSIHTGSDKFSIYPAIARHTHGRVHVKTAGTSYLEAVRLAAEHDPALFRAMLEDARAHFAHDRKTYFLDAQLDKVPAANAVADADLPGLLEQFDARQVLHMTFGTLLDRHGAAIARLVAEREDEWRAGLERHFARHIRPFIL